jgi:hypothetical protein
MTSECGSPGFVVDGRYLFTQRALATALLPEVFRELLKPTLVPAEKPVRGRRSKTA